MHKLAYVIVLIAVFSTLPMSYSDAPQVESQSDKALSVDNTGNVGERAWRSERMCGVNCLYLMLRFNGNSTLYETLERTLLHGQDSLTSLTELKNASQLEGMPVMIAKTDRHGLQSMVMPLIAHLETVTGRGKNKGHFVLVTSTDKAGVTFIDGTTVAARLADWKEFERDWSGYALVRERTKLGWLTDNSVIVLLGFLASLVIDVIVMFTFYKRISIRK